MECKHGLRTGCAYCHAEKPAKIEMEASKPWPRQIYKKERPPKFRHAHSVRVRNDAPGIAFVEKKAKRVARQKASNN